MKVSLNWVKEFTDVGLSVDELVEKIGAQLGAVEEVIDLGKKYQGIIIAKVVECADLENSDHLHVCKIDDGGKAQNVERDENGHVQVVCGAPNVREGLMVAWLPPGTTVPSTLGKDPFVLEAREIRGAKSNGMLASAAELGISDDHSGLLDLGEEAQPGADFAGTYGLNDQIIDIENKMFTHRPDCFGMLGVAREIAGIQQKPFKSPDWYLNAPIVYEQGSDAIPLQVLNDITDIVPRFMAVAIKNVEIKPSPMWLQSALTRAGVRPINNIVDITNYMMLLTGQPMHAYDYDKVRALDSGSETATIHIRYPVKGEKLKLLNGKEIEPRGGSIVIASATRAIGLGGVMGGSETEVDAATKNIILECASFDMYNIRRTSMEHGLFTDAVTRFTKGPSWLQDDRVMARAIQMVGELSGGQPAGKQQNDVKSLPGNKPVEVSARFINERLGLELSAQEMQQLLTNVEFSVEVNGETLAVTAPFWRTDIELREDVVEEIGRLQGYDKLPLELPRRTINPAKKDELLELKSKIRSTLSRAGANEVLTYSFVHGNLLDKVGQDKSQAFQITNALSPDLQYYRLSLTPSLLEKVHPNIKAGFDQFAIFELGKAHIRGQLDDEGLPREDELTALVIASADKLKKPGAPYYAAKKYLTNLVPAELSFKPVPEEMRKFDITKPYEMNRTAFVYAGDKFLGFIGEFKASVKRNLKLPKFCAGFELDIAALLDILQNGSSYVALPRFPKVTQDITLRVPADLPFAELANAVQQKLDEVKPGSTYLTLVPLGIYQGHEDKSHKNVTFRLEIASYERTLTDAEVAKLLDQAAAEAGEKLSAERV